MDKQTIPDGYILSEFGIIPDDWDTCTLGQLTSALESGVSVNALDKLNAFEHSLHVLKTSCVSQGTFFENEAKSILPSDIKRIKCTVQKNSLIISRMNTPALVGEVGYVRESKSNLFLPDRLWQLIVRKEHGISSRWLAYLLSYRPTAKAIKEMATGTSNSMKNISKGSFLSLKLPLPKSEEQTAIANALSDVDALIAELEKLIAKKQAIKTATMQQLLTGRTRLPEFANHPDGTPKGYKQTELGEIPEDWNVISFGDVLSIRHGKNQKQVEAINGKYPILATGGQIGWADSYLYDKPSVLIGRKGTIDKPRYAESPFWTVDTLFYSEIDSIADPKFIFYKFCMVHWMQYNEASGVPSLNAATIEKVLAAVPSKEEQTAIANILSDMDEEIQSLQQRLDKASQIKQGMMQELLTGKTRLV